MHNLLRHHSLVLLTAAILSAGLPAGARAAESAREEPSAADALSKQALNDLEIVRKRTLEPLLKPVDAEGVRKVLDAQRPDGTWPDVDYRNSNLMAWKTPRHLGKVMLLSRAYTSPESALHGDTRLRKAVLAGLDYWLERDFRNKNWWWNQIGVPRSLARILLLLDEELGQSRRKKGLEILARAKLGMTGQNLVWVAEITAKRAILEKNPRLLSEAVGSISRQLRMTPRNEGMQPDYSFRQHGPVLYSHGYGAGFVTDCSRVATQVAGTQFAFSREEVDNLCRLILDGHQWMTRGGTCDYGAIGREISRKGRNARYLHGVAKNMLQLSTGREEEFRALAERAAGNLSAPLEGNRHFWQSDIMTHHRKGYYSSARMYSRRTENTDWPCGQEGVKSHHVADGCNLVFRTGDEYRDIFPVWDWQKVPGTTVVQTPELSGKLRMRGNRAFVGGVSDGTYGLAAFDFVRNELAARKSWFFFDTELVCLGAGIRSTSDYPVATTINQCFLRGEVVAGIKDRTGDRQQELKRGRHSFRDLVWVHHDRIGYLFSQPAEVHISNDTRKGSWKEINREASGQEVTHDVFTLWIDHGTKPENASYSYLVLPGVPGSFLAARAARPDVRIIRNTVDTQAVWHAKLKLAGIAFYRSGVLSISEDLAVGVDKPCLVLVRKLPEALAISVSNPANEGQAVVVEVSRKLEGRGVEVAADGAGSRVSFELPDGQQAGRSVSRTVKIVGR